MDITLSEDIDAEYLEDVADILTNKEFLALNSYRHHVATTRLMHSINVSYISWLTAKKLGCDAQAAARAGLLHDFFLYDPREGRPSRELQAFCHPKVAARTSGETFKISEKERDAILSHMFPLGPLPNPGKHGLYPARTKYAPVRKSSILRLHWQETDAWQSARRKDEGFLSNCIKSAGEGAFQGAVSLTAVQRTGRVYPAPILCFFVTL